MKRKLFLTVLFTFTTESIWAVDSPRIRRQIGALAAGSDKISNVGSAIDLLARATGKANLFLYDELKATVKLGRSGEGAPQETTQDRLNMRITHLENRLIDVVKRCGPGVEKQRNGKKNDIMIEDRSLGFLPVGPPMAQSDRISMKEQLKGQTVADELGDFDFGGHSMPFQRPDFFGMSVNVPLGRFDPLGAAQYHEPDGGNDIGIIGTNGMNTIPEIPVDSGMGFPFEGPSRFPFGRRRRRYAKGEKVSKAKINKKIQRLNSSFEPMESFLDEQLENCSSTRVEILKQKVNKVKARIAKVVNRQGESVLQRQRKRRQRAKQKS